MIYEPREDSFLLKKYVKKYSKGRVLDIGTGSGIQALTALENSKDVLAVDINEECVEFVKNKGVNCMVSDLFENAEGKFDLIIFNPPYLPEDENEDKESKLITTGGKKGNEVIERFLKDVKRYLNKDGEILIVCSSLSGDVESMFNNYKLKFDLLEEIKFDFEILKVYLLK